MTAPPITPMAADHVPKVCPWGHRMQPPDVLVSWSPCTCRQARTNNGGHRTFTCWACHRERTYTAAMVPECVTPTWPNQRETAPPGP